MVKKTQIKWDVEVDQIILEIQSCCMPNIHKFSQVGGSSPSKITTNF